MTEHFVSREEVERLREENERLRQALIPFAFIGRQPMFLLGLLDEYDHARTLLGLEHGSSLDAKRKMRGA